MAGAGSLGMPLPPVDPGVDPMLGAPPVDPMMDPGMMAPPAPTGFQSTDPSSIAQFIASMFQQMRDADHQALDAQQDQALQAADPMIQAMLGGAGGAPMGGQPPVDPMMGFATGGGLPPVDPSMMPPGV